MKKVKDGDKPFFAYITTNAPHGPFIAPEKNEKRFTDLGFSKTTAGFYGMIENIDENVGLMLKKLEEWKLMNDTVIIFMSDNGMTGGGSGRQGKSLAEGYPFYNAGMKGLKGSADEGGVRVPFFVRWDGKVKPNVPIDKIAAHIDILPTLADLAGAKIPESQVEGRSLLPLIENPAVDWKDRYFFTHKGRWKTGEEPNNHQWKNFAVRNQRFRFVGGGTSRKKKDSTSTTGMLFDMEIDPGQTENVIDQHPEVVKEMRAAYEKFWKETRPLMVNEDAPMSPTRPFHVWFKEQTEAGGIPDWTPPEL